LRTSLADSIEKLMRMARAVDPEAAAEEAAERNRKHQATHRAKDAAAYVSANPIEHILPLVLSSPP
jgi:hypothetical protein